MLSGKSKYVECVPKYAQFKTRSKICLCQDKFSKSKTVTKNFKFQNFPKNNPREHCKENVYPCINAVGRLEVC